MSILCQYGFRWEYKVENGIADSLKAFKWHNTHLGTLAWKGEMMVHSEGARSWRSPAVGGPHCLGRSRVTYGPESWSRARSNVMWCPVYGLRHCLGFVLQFTIDLTLQMIHLFCLSLISHGQNLCNIWWECLYEMRRMLILLKLTA